jgi:hypothetical protein
VEPLPPRILAILPNVDARSPLLRSLAPHRARRSAISRAVSPAKSLILGSHPCSSSHNTSLPCPLIAAQCSALRPHTSVASTLTPPRFSPPPPPLPLPPPPCLDLAEEAEVIHVHRKSRTLTPEPARAATCRTLCRFPSHARMSTFFSALRPA